MSRYSGRQVRGASKKVRALKREEAEARNSAYREHQEQENADKTAE